MSHNTFGHLFRVTTYGESHGSEIGCIVDGVPPQIPLSEADIQPYLDKRRTTAQWTVRSRERRVAAHWGGDPQVDNESHGFERWADSCPRRAGEYAIHGAMASCLSE